MAAQLKVSKQRVREPVVGWTPHDDRRIVFYGITAVGVVQTTAGPMERARIYLKAELSNPKQDVAAHVGWVVQDALADPGANAPELWYWRDNYWLKARSPGKGDWYNRGDYLLYPVQVVEPDGFIARLQEERQEIITILNDRA